MKSLLRGLILDLIVVVEGCSPFLLVSTINHNHDVELTF